MLSRVHCSIEYRDNVGWIIKDGYSVKSKNGNYDHKISMNGTWYIIYKFNLIFFS
jgi:hypothetical protein